MGTNFMYTPHPMDTLPNEVISRIVAELWTVRDISSVRVLSIRFRHIVDTTILSWHEWCDLAEPMFCRVPSVRVTVSDYSLDFRPESFFVPTPRTILVHQAAGPITLRIDGSTLHITVGDRFYGVKDIKWDYSDSLCSTHGCRVDDNASGDPFALEFQVLRCGGLILSVQEVHFAKVLLSRKIRPFRRLLRGQEEAAGKRRCGGVQ